LAEKQKDADERRSQRCSHEAGGWITKDDGREECSGKYRQNAFCQGVVVQNTTPVETLAGSLPASRWPAPNAGHLLPQERKVCVLIS